MDNKQIANAYAIAQVLGYKQSIDEFKEKYEQYYSKTINELNSKPIEIAKVEAVSNPFRKSNF